MPTAACEPFTQMAERIAHNADAKFGGACVIVPPGDGKLVELLMFAEGTGTEAQFWTTIISLAQSAISEIDQKRQAARGFGVR